MNFQTSDEKTEVKKWVTGLRQSAQNVEKNSPCIREEDFLFTCFTAINAEKRKVSDLTNCKRSISGILKDFWDPGVMHQGTLIKKFRNGTLESPWVRRNIGNSLKNMEGSVLAGGSFHFPVNRAARNVIPKKYSAGRMDTEVFYD